jgi:2-dehydro-3-deoxyglucarate aldolase
MEIQSTSNILKKKISSNDIVIGARCTTGSSSIIELYGKLGLDFVWIDYEYSGGCPYDSTKLENLARTAEISDINLLLRIPENSPAVIGTVINAGIKTILVPKIETKEDVMSAIRCSYFKYGDLVGFRGSGPVRSSSISKFSGKKYAEYEDLNILVGIMIETKSAVENIEEILDVPNLGFIVIGPSDLSISLGVPFEKNHSEVKKAIRKIEKAASLKKIPLAKTAQISNVNEIEEAKKFGYNMLRLGDEFFAIKKTIGKILQEWNNRNI